MWTCSRGGQGTAFGSSTLLRQGLCVSVWYWQASGRLTPAVTEASPRSVENKLTETIAFDYPDSPIVRGKELGGYKHSTFDNLGK